MKENLREIASHFALEGPVTAIDSLGEGFINDTFIVRTEADAPDYILQRKNKAVFPDVPAMMDNIRRVTEHIRRGVIAAGGDPRREVMTVVPAKDGHLYHVDAEGEYWAATVFIDDTIAYNKADSRSWPARAAKASGNSSPSWTISPNRWRRRSKGSITSATVSDNGTPPWPAMPQGAEYTSRRRSAGSSRGAPRCSLSGRRSRTVRSLRA